jgi:hypothetical protein
LVSLNLLVLAKILIFLTLYLVADQRARAEPKATANRCSGRGMSNRSANETARSRASERADAGTFFTSCQWATGATRGKQNPSQQ